MFTLKNAPTDPPFLNESGSALSRDSTDLDLTLPGYRSGAVVLLLFIVAPIFGVCNCSMFCCTLLYVHSSIAIILIGKRELVALLDLSPWCIVMFVWLFLAVPWGCLQFVIVVFPDHTHLLFLVSFSKSAHFVFWPVVWKII